MKTGKRTESEPTLFVMGAVSKSLLGRLMHPKSLSPNTGAAAVFQGWIRADSIGDRTVGAIVYTAYREMGEQRMALIREELFVFYGITGLTVIHSIGQVRVGECCFFVRVTAPHRKAAFDACQVAVDRVKAELPIWGEELLLDGGAQWKVNKGI